MKKSLALLSVTLFLLTAKIILCAQDFKNVQEAKYISIYYAVDVSSGILTPLEKQSVTARHVGKGIVGFGGSSEGQAVVAGERSPIRFSSDQKLAFALRMESNLVDPSNVIGFSLVDVQKGARVIGSKKIKTSVIGSAKVIDSNGTAVRINVYKYGKSSYIFYPARPLSPGEYILTLPDAPYVYCFGIDPVPRKPSTDLTSLVGKYNSEDRKADYMELKADGTLLLQQEGKSYSGRYDAKDSELIFIVNGIASRGEIHGDTIIDSSKGKWVKQKP